MNDVEFTSYMAKKLNVSFKSAKDFLDAMVECMSEELENKGQVKLVDFGMFDVVKRAPRKGFNPFYRKSVNVPACNGIKFTPGKK